MKDVNIIIVVFNGENFIKNCLSSIFELDYPQGKLGVVVIDNASTDKSALIIQNDFPSVRFVSNKSNVGFGRACNQAFELCDSKYVALLNQDSRVGKNWLKELVFSLDNNPDVACCGAAEHPYSCEISLKDSLMYSKNIDNQIWMGGGSVLCRFDALKSVGFFDPFFFMYGEDIDLSWRLKLAGYRLMLNPNAIWHHHGKDRVVKESFRTFYSLKNRFYILFKFGSVKQIFASVLLYVLHKNICNSKSPSAVPAGSSDKNKERIDKIKLLFFIIAMMPIAFYARFKLRVSREKREEVDSWIRYTDEQLFSK